MIKAITQPKAGSVIDGVAWILDQCELSKIDIAAAYITTQGASTLISALKAGLGDQWPHVQKRWLTSFDYLRTTPLALTEIDSLPESKLRIHNSAVMTRRDCVPATPFHPKSIIFTGTNARFTLSGSGNVSRSGLTRGHEAGIIIGTPVPAPGDAAEAVACIDAFQTWFDELWGPASKATALIERYRELYDSQPNLNNPTPTEDDTTPVETKRGQLTPVDLRKLRVCANFLIEADKNITRNRGPGLPGNQLMMKRLSRVFFGFSPDDVARDTPIGHLDIAYAAHASHHCSLTFSNNLMDKLTLPIPGADGPPKYDGQNLLFKRVGSGRFSLTLGTESEKRQWRRRSQEISAAFKMGGGRAWGVF